MTPANDEKPQNNTMMLIAVGLLVYVGMTYLMPKPATTRLPATTAARTPVVDTRSAPARLAQRHTENFSIDGADVTVDNLGGGITSYRLRGQRFQRDGFARGPQMDMISTDREELRPLRIEVPGVAIPSDAVWSIERKSENAVQLAWQGDGVRVERTFESGQGPFQILQRVKITNVGARERRLRLQTEAFQYVRRADESQGFMSRSWHITQGICRHDGEVVRKTRDDLATRHGYRTPDFSGIENTYFVTALTAAEGTTRPETCGLSAQDRGPRGNADGTLFSSRLTYPVATIAAGQSQEWSTLAYIGPKDWDSLDRAGSSLVEVVNLGMFSAIARWFSVLLRGINGFVGNWGFAIILLTLMVRIAIYPLMARQFKTMAQMRPLKPEMDRINEMYAGDMEKKQAATMELYRKHGISPFSQLAGCLPILAQMPIFLALYASLSTNIELFHAPFALWWKDLSAPDPFFVLPIGISALMFIQQKLTPPAGMDPMQAKMMLYMMPIMMGAFSLFLPAGLGLYWGTSSLLSLLQQRFNESRLKKLDAKTTVVA